MNATVRAPEIDRPGLDWFNVAAPLSLADLRGRFVILDFWTFCCINCMHVLPTLRRIEEEYPNEVAVIGVHSPKFAAEKDPANVAQAIARYGIVHPVIHDPEFQLWQQYAVRAWPTLVFIDTQGHVLGQVPGEPDADRLAEAVASLVTEASAEGTLQPRELALYAPQADAGRLRFPSKIKALPRADGSRHWAIADGGHDQIVIVDDGGAEIARIGAGTPGLKDGSLKSAQFAAPQGLACETETIYAADTNNHALRQIDLKAGMVTTLAGTGTRGRPLGTAAPATLTALASPWDIAVDGRHLYFANAGTHQLGALALDDGAVTRLAGSGGEDITDGPAGEAQLAQPSGLALSPDGASLYFVDSETSALRVLRLGGEARVETLIGVGLFDFGHANGGFTEARLQHPLGIDWHENGLVVADSYNGALRRVDLAAARIADVDDGFDCEDSLCLPFGEPAGVADAGDGRLFMVDTNNHRVLLIRPGERAYRTWFA